MNEPSATGDQTWRRARSTRIATTATSAFSLFFNAGIATVALAETPSPDRLALLLFVLGAAHALAALLVSNHTTRDLAVAEQSARSAARFYALAWAGLSGPVVVLAWALTGTRGMGLGGSLLLSMSCAVPMLLTAASCALAARQLRTRAPQSEVVAQAASRVHTARNTGEQ